MAIVSIALLSAAAAPLYGQPPADTKPESPTGAVGTTQPAAQAGIGELDDLWAAVDDELQQTEDRVLARPGSRKQAVDPADESAVEVSHSWVRTIGSLAGVVALIFLLAWGYRVVSNGGKFTLGGGARRAGLVEVVSRTALTARQALCLVRVGPRLVLIGQSADNLRTLDVIDDANTVAQLLGEAARGRKDANTTEFAACLEREATAYEAPEDAPDETTGVTEEQRVIRAREKLNEALQRVRAATARR